MYSVHSSAIFRPGCCLLALIYLRPAKVAGLFPRDNKSWVFLYCRSSSCCGPWEGRWTLLLGPCFWAVPDMDILTPNSVPSTPGPLTSSRGIAQRDTLEPRLVLSTLSSEQLLPRPIDPLLPTPPREALLDIKHKFSRTKACVVSQTLSPTVMLEHRNRASWND